MTIGEVFDFEISDEFHISGNADGQTPNADRIKIIDKYFSEDSSAVFYVRFHDSYYSSVENNELLYQFWTETDTVSYANIDSIITSYNFWTSYDTSMIYYDTIIGFNEYYCDSLVNGYQYTVNSFEPVFYSNEFGKGLGMVKNYYYNPANYSMFDNVLFYYKKNGVACGMPDTTTVSIPEANTISDFIIGPIPARDILRIKNIKNIEIESIFITNLNGQILKQFDSSITQLNISELASGIYILKILSEKGELSKKIIIE